MRGEELERDRWTSPSMGEPGRAELARARAVARVLEDQEVGHPLREAPPVSWPARTVSYHQHPALMKDQTRGCSDADLPPGVIVTDERILPAGAASPGPISGLTPGLVVHYLRRQSPGGDPPVSYPPIPAIVLAVHGDGRTVDLAVLGEGDRSDWARGKGLIRFRGAVRAAADAGEQPRCWNWVPR